MVARMIQYMFCADDSDWAPRGDNLGLFDGDGNDLGPATVDDLADKAHLLCLSGTKGSSRESEFPDFTVVAGDLGQALQGADIRGEADVDLGHAKLGVGRAQTDIACGCNVYGEAEGEAVEGADDGLAAGGEGGDGCLEGTEVGVEGEGLAGGVGGRGGEEGLGVEVQAGGEGGVRGGAEDEDAYGGVSGGVADDVGEFCPHPAGSAGRGEVRRAHR